MRVNGGVGIGQFGLEVFGDGPGGQADVGEGEIARDDRAPAGGAKLNGIGPGGSIDALLFPIKGLFFQGINIADEQDAQKTNHRAENQRRVLAASIWR